MSLPEEAEKFLRDLRLGLLSLPGDERDEIVAEVRSHLADRHAAGKAALLDGFEDATTYASRFVAETALRGALARGTSLELLRALLTGARTGVLMLLTVVPLVAVQLIGAALVLVGALKPFLPARVGLFVDSANALVALGAWGGDLTGLRELLGVWSMPLFLIAGALLFWASNRLLRVVARLRLARTGRPR